MPKVRLVDGSAAARKKVCKAWAELVAGRQYAVSSIANNVAGDGFRLTWAKGVTYNAAILWVEYRYETMNGLSWMLRPVPAPRRPDTCDAPPDLPPKAKKPKVDQPKVAGVPPQSRHGSVGASPEALQHTGAGEAGGMSLAATRSK